MNLLIPKMTLISPKLNINGIDQILEATPHETTTVRPLTYHVKNHQSKTNKTYETLVEKQERTHKITFFHGPLHMDMPVLAEQQELIYISSVQTQDVVWKTCRVRWMVGTDGERGPGKSMLSAWLDDDRPITNLLFQELLRDMNPFWAISIRLFQKIIIKKLQPLTLR